MEKKKEVREFSEPLDKPKWTVPIASAHRAERIKRPLGTLMGTLRQNLTAA